MSAALRSIKTLGFNGIAMVPGSTGGIEIYARELVPRIAKLLPDTRVLMFVCREGFEGLDGDSMGAELVRCNTRGRNAYSRIPYEQFRLPLDARRHKVDLLHSLCNTAPVVPGVPHAVSIHDLIPHFVSEPLLNSEWKRHAFNRLIDMAARRADRVLTLSHASLKDLVEVAKVPASKIDVVPPAGRPPGDATPRSELRQKYDLGEGPMILSPSARRSHKNLPRLFEALALIQTDPRPILVLPGYQTGQEDSLAVRTRELGIVDRVKMLGWISDEDLDGLYATATCFALPSYMEGFGLPVVEAMERGLPVATSNVSAMPEAGGDAALYFDPFDSADIAEKITRLLTDGALRERLVCAGREQIKQFSWDHSAELTVQSYERILAAAG